MQSIELTLEPSRELASDLFLSNVKIKKKLGEGIFSEAYLSELNHEGNVILGVLKLNKKMIASQMYDIDTESGNIQLNTSYKDEDGKEHIQTLFIKEVLNWTRVLSQNARFKSDADMHSGHNFLHKLYYHSSSIYCILSEPCEGNVEHLMDNSRLSEADMHSFMVQVGLGVHYMLFILSLAHTDVKPGNVLWTGRSGHHCFKISDFGYLDHVLDENQQILLNNEGMIVSALYAPFQVNMSMCSPRGDPKYLNSGKYMVFTFCMSLIELFDPKAVEGFSTIHHAVIMNEKKAKAHPKSTWAVSWLPGLERVYGSVMHRFTFRLIHETSGSWFAMQPNEWKSDFDSAMRSVVEEFNALHTGIKYSI